MAAAMRREREGIDLDDPWQAIEACYEQGWTDGLPVVPPTEVLVERMLERGRADDTVEAIRRRLDTYHADTKPLIDYYGDLVVEIDGEGSVAEVNGRILDSIGAPRPADLPDV